MKRSPKKSFLRRKPGMLSGQALKRHARISKPLPTKGTSLTAGSLGRPSLYPILGRGFRRDKAHKEMDTSQEHRGTQKRSNYTQFRIKVGPTACMTLLCDLGQALLRLLSLRSSSKGELSRTILSLPPVAHLQAFAHPIASF